MSVNHSKKRDNNIINLTFLQIELQFYLSFMGSSGGTTAIAAKKFNQEYFEGEDDAFLTVRSRDFTIVGQTIQHHFLVAKISRDDLFRVYEWGTRSNENKNEPEFYVTQKINGRICQSLSNPVPLVKVRKTARKVSDGRQYDLLTFNCCHWTEKICKEFNWTVVVNGLCDCSKKKEDDSSSANLRKE